MKTLFNEFYAPTDEGNELSHEAHEKIEQIFKTWVEERGFSPREVSAILHIIVCNNESYCAIMHASKLLDEKEGKTS